MKMGYLLRYAQGEAEAGWGGKHCYALFASWGWEVGGVLLVYWQTLTADSAFKYWLPDSRLQNSYSCGQTQPCAL